MANGAAKPLEVVINADEIVLASLRAMVHLLKTLGFLSIPSDLAELRKAVEEIKQNTCDATDLHQKLDTVSTAVGRMERRWENFAVELRLSNLTDPTGDRLTKIVLKENPELERDTIALAKREELKKKSETNGS